MAASELARGVDITTTGVGPGTEVYANTSGSDVTNLLLRVSPDRGATAFVYYEAYIEDDADATVTDADLDHQGDVPPNGHLSTFIPLIANGDHLVLTAETANVLRASLYQL